MHVKQYYSELFSSKAKTGEGERDLEGLISSKRKLNQEKANKLDGPINISELSNVVKSMQNNKTPGIDGFPVEFLKMFCKDLKFFILRALNESYNSGILPRSLRQAVICCLPKGNKPRNIFKNWRPISLLSVLYKMTKSVIANRQKSVLPDLISPTQRIYKREIYR